MTHAGHCSTVEADTGGPMGPAGLAAMSSMFSERACLKKENMEKLRTISNINLWPTQPTFSLIHIHACMHAHSCTVTHA